MQNFSQETQTASTDTAKVCGIMLEDGTGPSSLNEETIAVLRAIKNLA